MSPVSSGEGTNKLGTLTFDEYGRVIRQAVEDRLNGRSGTYDYTYDAETVYALVYVPFDFTEAQLEHLAQFWNVFG